MKHEESTTPPHVSCLHVSRLRHGVDRTVAPSAFTVATGRFSYVSRYRFAVIGSRNKQVCVRRSPVEKTAGSNPGNSTTGRRCVPSGRSSPGFGGDALPRPPDGVRGAVAVI